MNNYSEKVIEWAAEFGPKLLLVLLVLIIGFWLIKKVHKISEKGLEKAKGDKGIVTG